MRGKVPEDAIISTAHRITPAYAGKSFTTQLESTEDEDHPRLCGEKRSAKALSFPNSGSPPPMRGKAGAVAGNGASSRITPAYAGKSSFPNDGGGLM